MVSSSRKISIPPSTDDVTGTPQKELMEMEDRYKATGSCAKVIHVIGRSGAGKSSYTEDLSGLSGHAEQSVDAVTLEFRISKALIEKEEYFIMDTPGFDPGNEKRTFLGIVRGIQAIQPFAQIVGVLFFTPINLPRFDAFDRKLVAFIRALCGDDYIPNITFITTFWTAPSPRQQAVFNKQLENLRRNWNEEFDVHAPRTYQHGRGYNANGVDTGRFLDWFEDRDQIAQHGKDMIARYYGEGKYNNVAPKIVRELAAGVSIHETKAGKYLQVDSPSSGITPSKTSTQDNKTRSAKQTRLTDTNFDSKRQSAASAKSTHNYPRPEPQTTSNWLPFLQSVFEFGTSVAQNRGGSVTYSSGQGIQTSKPVMTSNMQFNGDRNSSVDWMKFANMDSSKEGRLRYAAENNIGGTPFSAAWNDSIRRNVQHRFE